MPCSARDNWLKIKSTRAPESFLRIPRSTANILYICLNTIICLHQYCYAYFILGSTHLCVDFYLKNIKIRPTCIAYPGRQIQTNAFDFMYNKPLTIAATTLILCAPVLILSSCDGKKEAGAARPILVPEVQVTKLVVKSVPVNEIWVGTLRGTEDAEIRSQVTGYLLSKDYKDGSYVKQGQTLFQIDPAPFKAALGQAQGRLEQYKATLKKYNLDVERYTPLVKSGSVSRKQLDDALQQVQETEASIVTAKAQVDEAQINLTFTTIKAPISGLAGLATPSIGNLLTPSSPTPLTTISSIDPIRVDFSVSEKDFLNAQNGNMTIDKGFKFDVILANGTLCKEQGTVVAVDRNVDAQTGTINMVGQIPNPDLTLRPGMFVRVEATVKTIENATMVPPRAIMSSQSASFIVYLDGKNIPHMQVVQPGEVVDGMQVINVIPTPQSSFTKDSPIVVEGIMQAARVQGLSPVKPIPYVHVISQPPLKSLGAQPFQKSVTPEGMHPGSQPATASKPEAK